MGARPLNRPAATPADPADPADVRSAVARAGGVASTSVEQRETHFPWVFLAAERAFKLKKPIVLPFLDYGKPERRREMCRAEIRLNRRLAPDLYVGVRSLVPAPVGLELSDQDDPSGIDYVVEMRRYDERQTLAATLDRGELTQAQAEELALTLARFHADCPPASLITSYCVLASASSIASGLIRACTRSTSPTTSPSC